MLDPQMRRQLELAMRSLDDAERAGFLTPQNLRRLDDAARLFRRHAPFLQDAARVFRHLDLAWPQIELLASAMPDWQRAQRDISLAMSAFPPAALQTYLAALAWSAQFVTTTTEFYASDCPYRWVRSVPEEVLGETLEAYDLHGEVAALQTLAASLSSEPVHEKLLQRCKDCSLSSELATPLQAALQAHRDGQYALSVPVLMSQTEGIFRRVGVHLGVVGNVKGATAKKAFTPIKTILKKSREALAEHAGVLAQMAGDPGTAEDEACPLLWGPFVEFLCDEFFSDTYRNPILHGEWAEYGTESLSQQCLLALNEALNTAEIVAGLDLQGADGGGNAVA